MKHTQAKRNVFYILTGSMLEHMDSMLFSLYLPILAGYFFGAQDDEMKWFLGFLSFSLYYVIRPLGALMLGMIGDRYGRKSALLISISVMALATLGIGIAPSYAEVGLYAVLFFLFFRLLQGLSAGGEYSTAMTYLYETAPPNKQLFYGTLLISATHVGGTIASIFANLNPENFQYVFLIAGLIGVISLQGRVMLTETYDATVNEKFVVRDYIDHSALMQYLPIIAATISAVFIFFTLMVYFNKIIIQQFSVGMQTAFSINLMLNLMWAVFPPILGIIGDRFKLSFSKIMRFGSLGTVMSLPLLIIASSLESLAAFILAQSLITLFHIVFCLPIPKMICSFFAINTRNAHVAFSYSIGVSVTAALMPTMNDFAYKTMHIYGTAGLLVLFAGLGFISTINKKSN